MVGRCRGRRRNSLAQGDSGSFLSFTVWGKQGLGFRNLEFTVKGKIGEIGGEGGGFTQGLSGVSRLRGP